MFSFKSRAQSIKKVSRINTKKFQKGNLSQHTIKKKILNFNMKIYKGSVRLSSNQRGEWFVMYICIYIYILRLCNNCMLRPLRKANAETRRVFNKALKTEAHSPLCKLYIYIYIYIYRFHQNVQYVVSTLKRKQVSPMVINDWLKFVNSLSV